MTRPLQFMPDWANLHLNSQAVSQSQALCGYADYYCLNGVADDLNDHEIERMVMPRPPMTAYASRTGTRRNLTAMREAGWRLVVSATGVLRSEGLMYGLDNGAWTAFQQGCPLDEDLFMRAVDLMGENADWIVLPDIVAGGHRSLDYTLLWLNRLRGIPVRLLIAVQDGMLPEDVRELLDPGVGIFVGGTTAWKERTAGAWGVLARRRNCYLHVGRVNSIRRIAICGAAGANSWDGSSASRFAKTVPKLDKANRQLDLFAATKEWQD